MARRILRTREAAEYVGLASSTLEKMRLGNGGPRFIRLGGRAVGYDIRDLDAWLDEQRSDGSGDIAWNFAKFLVDREGRLIARFSPTVEPCSNVITSRIDEALEIS